LTAADRAKSSKELAGSADVDGGTERDGSCFGGKAMAVLVDG
jgi:hypothetical protein